MDKKNNTTKSRLDQLTSQEERIIRLLREERKQMQKKFPLPYALLATFGVLVTTGGLNLIIEDIPFLYDNPIVMVAMGLALLIVTGAAYRKLG